MFLLITFSETFFSNKLNNPTACDTKIRSSHPEVFLGKCVLKICNKFTEEHPYRYAISISLLFNFNEIALRHGYSPVNLLHFFITSFSKNTSGRLLLPDAKKEFQLLEQTTFRVATSNQVRTKSQFESVKQKNCYSNNSILHNTYINYAVFPLTKVILYDYSELFA